MKITMLCLLGIMVILTIRSVTLTGSSEGLRFFLVPDFERMAKNGIGNVIFGAMSQAFFTLSIGMGGMAIFGSYLDKKRSLAGESLSIVLLDTCVALMAGLIVIPSCFAFGVEPDAGPGLVFITLPNIFTQMAGGRIWGSLFFLFLFCAALSTIVGVFENIVSFWMDLFGWKRTKAVGINILLITVLSIPCTSDSAYGPVSSRLAQAQTLWIWKTLLYPTISFRSAQLYIFCSVRTKTDGAGKISFRKQTAETA